MLGLLRSLFIYYAVPLRHQRLKAIYRPFREAGELMFDVGAHVGNRSRAWIALGGTVVALEPQENCLRFLRRLYRGSHNMEIVPAAVGDSPGIVDLYVSSTHPTMTTTTESWIADLESSGMSRGVRWERRTTVPVTTLDRLIAQFGLPAFVKIDVEGAEQLVLAGLSEPIPAVSFEYLPTQTERALACVDRLERLGSYRFNYCVGERHRFVLPQWVAAESIVGLLRNLSPGSRSGDIYARLATPVSR
ncbi:MAG: FkbM family methyltransferase [Spirochaetaceae bacterium]